MTEQHLGAREKAELYLAGYWEGEHGWQRMDRPCIADLDNWTIPKVYRTWQRYTAHLEITHPAEVDSEMLTLVRKWGSLYHPKWVPDAYLEFLLGENPRLTAYRLNADLVGIEFNLRYEEVCATHMFAWERELLKKTNLGKFCLAYEAIRCHQEGCRYFAMGKIYPYKEAVFRTGLMSFKETGAVANR